MPQAMNRAKVGTRVAVCYAIVPTMFSDADLEVDTAAIKRHVRFLRSHGVAQLAEVGKLGQTPPDLSRSELRSPSASECIDGDRSDPQILPLEGRGRLPWRTGLGIFLTTVQ